MKDDASRKAQLVRSNLEKLARIPQSSYDEFAADFRNTEAALHLLQTSIQALVDMGSKACASAPRGDRAAKRPGRSA